LVDSAALLKPDVFGLLERAVSVGAIQNQEFFNKIYQGRQFRQVVKHNKLIRSVYDFITNNDLLVILADKNLGLTIVDQSWYHINMRAHFFRPELFDEVPCPGPMDLEHEQAKLQMTLRRRGAFNVMCIEAATALFPKNVESLEVPRAYGLIKLHKTPHKLRIITPVVNWVNVPAAQFVASKLQPYVDELPHVLPNSLTLVSDLQKLRLPSHCLMSCDITDMYNSVNQQDALEGI